MKCLKPHRHVVLSSSSYCFLIVIAYIVHVGAMLHFFSVSLWKVFQQLNQSSVLIVCPKCLNEQHCFNNTLIILSTRRTSYKLSYIWKSHRKTKIFLKHNIFFSLNFTWVDEAQHRWSREHMYISRMSKLWLLQNKRSLYFVCPRLHLRNVCGFAASNTSTAHFSAQR